MSRRGSASRRSISSRRASSRPARLPAGPRRSAPAPSISASPRPANGAAIGTVDWIEHLGDQNHLHVSVGDHKLVTLADPEPALEAGDDVALDAASSRSIFDAAGNGAAGARPDMQTSRR